MKAGKIEAKPRNSISCLLYIYWYWTLSYTFTVGECLHDYVYQKIFEKIW